MDGINEAETEEFHKNLLSDFLKNTGFGGQYSINTKGRNDLVIHLGKEATTPVGVIIEAKKPGNKAEMPTRENLNVKALHELLLYYLRERITEGNLELRHLVVTNVYEWYLFDAQVFERLFASNTALLKQFRDFSEGRLAGNTTDFFYKHIAAPALEAAGDALKATHFDLRTFTAPLRSANRDDDRQLIPLFKILSPEHLLKRPFANDSNSLDRTFYAELLHLIGLTEVKEGGKKLIRRKAAADRDPGSLLENTITQLESLGKTDRLANAADWGATREEQVYSIALELVITWINRILFLKLLEAQLVAFNRGNRDFAFLRPDLLVDYDDLNKLFFRVLARTSADRDAGVTARFAHVPYLNSSLFEVTELEHNTLMISMLEDRVALPLPPGTVLKDANGRKRTGQMDALAYLLAFLDAYDFSSEGAEEIEENNKTLINASVLGLIFEKINGYRDGSFFTPGFVTMYMCRETIRRAVVRKFKERENKEIETYEDLLGYTATIFKAADIKRLNDIFNEIKVCDPAVGSGHFLVSALNELIAIKSELHLLSDEKHIGLRVNVSVDNDELSVYYTDGELFKYTVNDSEAQRVQKSLFREKQTLIENCLFGVDINPNSVKICRLRLWIELLKNAYYRGPDVLETLPNIDINIKCGNSLVSRFGLQDDLKQALRKNRQSIPVYRAAVQSYRHARSKEEKREMEKVIAAVRHGFTAEIGHTHPLRFKINKLRNELFEKFQSDMLFEAEAVYGNGEGEDAKREKAKEALMQAIEKTEAEMESFIRNPLFTNAFEWRFEFPEVLNDEGDFLGFDVVMGNPPYIRQEELGAMKPYLQQHYATWTGTADLYVYFVERGLRLLRPGSGLFCYILPNKWMRAGYGKALRSLLLKQELTEIVDFGDLPVFDEATTYPCILSLSATPPLPEMQAMAVDTLAFGEKVTLHDYVVPRRFRVQLASLQSDGWVLSDSHVQALLDKLRSKGTPLGEYVGGKIYRGVLTGLNEAFVVDTATRDRLIAADPGSADVIRPFLAGRDIKRYQQPKSDKWLILFKNGQTRALYGNVPEAEAWAKLRQQYPAVCDWLLPFAAKAQVRTDKGHYWWELRACDYYEAFEQEKILYQEIAAYSSFTNDTTGIYPNNKIFLISSQNKALLGFLNSRLAWFMLKRSANILRGALAMQTPYILSLLITPEIIENQQIATLAEAILAAKRADPGADTAAQEAEIDALVYGLYGLDAAEIALVEAA